MCRSGFRCYAWRMHGKGHTTRGGKAGSGAQEHAGGVTVRIRVRRARSSDGAGVASLLAGLGGEFHISPARGAPRLRRTEDSVFLAVSRGEPLGLVAVNSCQPVHADHRYGRIMTLVVRPDQRRKGIGRILVRHALAYLKRLGCRKVELTSRVYRGGAHRFYRAMGFRATATRFSLLLRGQRG